MASAKTTKFKFQTLILSVMPTYCTGGGNTESVFRNSPKGTIKNLLWESQMVTDPKYFDASDMGIFNGLHQDEKAVVFVAEFKIPEHMEANKKACDAVIKSVGLFLIKIYIIIVRYGCYTVD